MNEKPCPICLQYSQSLKINDNNSSDEYSIHCRYCGEFAATGTLFASLSHEDKIIDRALLSAVVRNRSHLRIETHLDTSNIQIIIDSVNVPKTPNDKVSHLVKIFGDVLQRPGNKWNFDYRFDYPLLFSYNADEAYFYEKNAAELGLIELPQHSSDEYKLTLSGWEFYHGLSFNSDAKKVFIAMWFSESTKEVWEKGIKPAIDDCGFVPLRIDLVEHNEKICDRIIAEIRSCSLLIADFTGQRGGVYFEAGFAYGLGKPVIWTCKDDELDKLHFDTRQYNHITWSNAQELKEKLFNRIKATIQVG